MWLLTLDKLMFSGFVYVDPSSILVVLVGINEHDALEGSYHEILGFLECLKELETPNLILCLDIKLFVQNFLFFVLWMEQY